MPTQFYARAMARHNIWQNQSLIAAANSLTAEARAMDRGAFFGSIQRTFSHLMLADTLWLARLSGQPVIDWPFEKSAEYFADWTEFCEERVRLDAAIWDWASNVPAGWFDGAFTWRSVITGEEITMPKPLAVMHVFNHQTHHRGQIHTMLTAAGAKPDDTDIPLVPKPLIEQYPV